MTRAVLRSPRPLLLPSDRMACAECGAVAPRVDYLELAKRLGGAPMLAPPPNDMALAAKLEERSASDFRQAILAARQARSVSVYVSFSEKVGLPLALLNAARRVRRPHVLIAHHLTSPKKRALQKRTGWLRRFTHIVVVSSEQAAYLQNEAGIPADRVTYHPHSVDTAFWCPAAADAGAGTVPATPFVLSVGRERRDYATLLEVARQLAPLPFVIVASSLWSRSPEVLTGAGIPANVTVRGGLAFPDLRSLYARASVVAVPLEAGTRYAAGATGLLEGMAMARPVVVSATPGLAGYAADGETVRLVPAGKAAPLAEAIRDLIADPDGADRLGERARRHAVARHALDDYVSALAAIVERAAETR